MTRRFMHEAFIVDAVRTPMGKGKEGGSLSSVHPVDLLAATLTAVVERTDIDPDLVDDVLVGCVGQNGEQSATVGRQAWLATGYAEHVPSTTIERKCGSSQQAVDFAVQGVMAGAYDLAVVGGVESMSRVPMGSARQGADPFGPAVRRRYPVLVPQGVSAELVAQKWGLDREALDAYAVESHARAAAARAAGAFTREIVPVRTDDGVVDSDETIREGTTTEKLAGLKPAFATDEYTAAFPDVTWSVTAGNSSQLTDGAGAMLVASAEAVERHGLTPLARIMASAVVGDDPTLMLTGPIPATRKVLERSGLRIDELDAVEVNEAFAPVPLAWAAEFPELDRSLLNPRGGAIALGHPLGASGVRLMTTMLRHLQDTGGRRGLQTMCEAGGMANAAIVELV